MIQPCLCLTSPWLESTLIHTLPLFLIRGQGHEMFVSVVKTSFQLFARGMDASNLNLARRKRMGDIRGV